MFSESESCPSGGCRAGTRFFRIGQRAAATAAFRFCEFLIPIDCGTRLRAARLHRYPNRDLAAPVGIELE